MIGRTLSHYQVTSTLGAGGMGEVYRATDTQLGREVAIKVLPAELAQDPGRIARFEREAKVLASLNHSNIAHVYGFESATPGDGPTVHFLAMELVEGEDLSERLKRGPLPVDEALECARQIAQALEEAHEHGIVHRDLKPANIKIAPDGKLKVLDFGLARAGAGEASSGSSADLSRSPTLAHGGTQAGVILGTAAYMSPEQARGKPVDKRADIWAFGVVLYEMLTGRQLFAGETVSDILAAVLTREVDLNTLPPATPPGVRRLLTRCLEREPRTRLRDIGDARADLAPGVEPEAPRLPSKRAMAGPLSLGLAVLASLMAGWAVWERQRPRGTAAEATHAEIGLPTDIEPTLATASSFALSPDGRMVMMVGWRDGQRRMFVRTLDSADAREVPGSSAAISGAFSPDGLSVVLLPASGEVTCLSLIDQQRRVVATGADLAGALFWSSAGIVFSRGGSLLIVGLDGAAPRRLTALDAARGEIAHGQPTLLPGDRTVLFTSTTPHFGEERIEAVSIPGGERKVVVERATTPVWSPTGHLLFARGGATLAVELDPATATVRGTAVPVIPSGTVEALTVAGGLGLQLSATGTLLYAPAGFDYKRLVSVGPDGAALDLGLPSDRYECPRVSPDGRRLLVGVNERWLEVLDLARGTRARLAGGDAAVGFATWSADGRRVAFKKAGVVVAAAADGSGASGAVPSTTINDFPSASGPDPDSFLLSRVEPDTSADVFLASFSGAFEPRALVQSPAFEGGAQLSPDGRWLLHQSNASGRNEIVVRRYPELDRPWQASEGEGVQPRWSRDGRQIVYRNGRDLVAVSFDGAGVEPALGKPRVLFTGDYARGNGVSIANYDGAPEGRFIMLALDPSRGRLHVVFHWTEELKRILAQGGVR